MLPPQTSGRQHDQDARHRSTWLYKGLSPQEHLGYDAGSRHAGQSHWINLMDTERDDSTSPLSHHAWASLLADAPWKAKSFLLAGAATIGGTVSWLSNMTSPTVAKMGASFLGGFLIGWAFRRFLKTAALIAGITLAGVAALEATGWIALDWVSIERQISQGFRWLQGEAEGLKTLLTGYMPSAGAGGAGAFFGFRRK